MSKLVTAKKCTIPYEYAKDESVEKVTQAFKDFFGENVEIVNKNVGRLMGGKMGHVYLHNKHIGKVVTIIIWEGKEKIYKKRGDYK